MNYYQLTVEAERSLKDTINSVDLLVEEGVFSSDTSSALAELKSSLETLEYVKDALKDWDEDFANLSSREQLKFNLLIGGASW